MLAGLTPLPHPFPIHLAIPPSSPQLIPHAPLKSITSTIDAAPDSAFHLQFFVRILTADLLRIITMANPKRIHSKRRARVRRAGNRFVAPQISTDPTDGTAFRPHRVNPANGMYRGRQVLPVES